MAGGGNKLQQIPENRLELFAPGAKEFRTRTNINQTFRLLGGYCTFVSQRKTRTGVFSVVVTLFYSYCLPAYKSVSYIFQVLRVLRLQVDKVINYRPRRVFIQIVTRILHLGPASVQQFYVSPTAFNRITFTLSSDSSDTGARTV